MRRAVLFVLFMSIAFFAGLVVTGRMRTAGETSAATAGQAPPPRTSPAVAISGGLPVRTSVAPRTISSVTNCSSTQSVRSPI